MKLGVEYTRKIFLKLGILIIAIDLFCYIGIKYDFKNKILRNKEPFRKVSVPLMGNRAEDVSFEIRDFSKKKKPIRKGIRTKVKDVYKMDGRKIAYLTFDDGPTNGITTKILDILKNNSIFGTFFIVGKNAINNPDIVKREVKEGHAIANHSYTHNYSKIYSSKDDFSSELNETEKVLKIIEGKEPSKIFRFPGGAFDKKGDFKEVLSEFNYEYIDWNCLNGDAEAANVPKDKLISNIKQYSSGKEKLVILMHDSQGKENTVETLQEVIDYLKSQGFEFGVLE